MTHPRKLSRSDLHTSETSVDPLDAWLLDQLQADFPIHPQPWRILADRARDAGLTLQNEAAILDRVAVHKQSGLIRQIGPIFDTRALGYASNLVAARVAPARLESAAAVINAHPGVSHNYLREAAYNLWFTLATPPGESLTDHLKQLSQRADLEAYLPLPAVRTFHIGVKLSMTDAADQPKTPRTPHRRTNTTALTDFDKRAIHLTQDDLPLTLRPFDSVCQQLSVDFTQLAAWFERMAACGVMRRFAAILRHRQAGFSANGMGVWVVAPEQIEAAGRIAGAFEPVSHCYQRPTAPDWPYNLYTMVHARSREQCEAHLAELARQLAPLGVRRPHVLYSTREFKKQRIRYFEPWTTLMSGASSSVPLGAAP